MLNGRLYDAATLDETGGRESKRRPFWWEARETRKAERGTRN
jgi:hypothetical protein